MVEYEGFDVFATAAENSPWQPLKQLRMGFDKRATSVDAVPCGDGSTFLLHCSCVVVCIIITTVTAPC